MCPWCGKAHSDRPTFYLNCPRFAGSTIFNEPPDYEPDDGEAQRIAETYAAAAAELDAQEAGDG